MRRLALAFLVVLFCSAFQSTGFSGCGGSSPPPADLPPGDEVACFTDTDCAAPDGCVMRSCIGGTCIDRGVRDDDLDGIAPIACGGTDCDDFDGSRFPGAIEYCDGRDQDCDDSIDEDATPTPQGWYFSTTDLEPSIAAYGPGLLVAAREFGSSNLTLQVTDRLGNPTGAAALLFEGESVIAHDLLQRDPDTVTVIAALPSRLAIAVLEVGSDFVPTVPVEVPASADVSGLAATAYPGGTALAWIEGGDVRFWTSEMAVPVTVTMLAESGGLDLAWDGETIVLAVPLNGALFLDPATGDAIATRVLDGRTWAAEPLASDGGGVIALLRDAFDHAITPFDAVSLLGRTPAPTVADRSMAGRVDVLGDQVLVTRFSSGGTSVPGVTLSILDRELILGSTFDTSTLGSLGGTAYDWDVAMHADFISIITSYDSTAYGVTLTCGF